MTVIDLKKSDFFLGGRFKGERKRKRDPYGVHLTRKGTYQYRYPIGYNEDGSLRYSKDRKEVKGQDWTYPASIFRNTDQKWVDPETQDIGDCRCEFCQIDDVKVIRQIGDTASHEAGHSAHDIADPRRRNHEWDEKIANKERGGYGLFDEKNASSADEHVAYITEYPFKRGRWGDTGRWESNERNYYKGMRGHPDVKSTYYKKLGGPLKATHPGGYQRDPRRNLRNAVLDMAAGIGKRTGAGNFQFGDMDSAANRKKQAEREIRPLLQQIEKLPLPNAQSFSELPQELQEAIGSLRTRDMLSRWMEENHEVTSQQELDTGRNPNSIHFMAENPEMFFDNYEQTLPDFEPYGRYGDWRLAKPAVSVIPDYDYRGVYDRNPELIDALERQFGNPEYSVGWGIKPKTKSNPYMRTPKKYLVPKFGPEAILDDIKDAFATAEENEGVEFDSSRAFMKSWGLFKAPIYDENNQVIDADAIYSGGDKGDEGGIRYATEDIDQALAYALFGSAVGELPRWVDGSVPPHEEWEKEYGEIPSHVMNRVPMRRTLPAMWKTPNTPDKDVYVTRDMGGNSDSYIFQEGFEPTERMPDKDVKWHIEDILEDMTGEPHSPKSPRGYGYHAAETSADGYLPHEQVQHMKESLQRLDGTLPAKPHYLNDQMMPYLATAWRDEFKETVNNLKEFGGFEYDDLHPMEQATYDWLRSLGALD